MGTGNDSDVVDRTHELILLSSCEKDFVIRALVKIKFITYPLLVAYVGESN